MEVIEESTKVLFSSKEILSSGYPLPTIRNKKSIRVFRDYIGKKDLANLVLFGQSVEDDIFFIPDILKHAVRVFNKHKLIK
jgi:hypothetical protein